MHSMLSKCSAPFCAILAALLLATGCQQQLTQAEIKFLETRELDLPYDASYQAAMNGLFALGYTIDHTDKASGVMTGKRVDPNTGAKIGAAVAFGVIGLLATKDKNESVTFMLTPIAATVTQLRMKVLIDGSQMTDRQYMTAIWQQIEREAMMESRPVENSTSTQPTSGPGVTPNEPSQQEKT